MDANTQLQEFTAQSSTLRIHISSNTSKYLPTGLLWRAPTVLQGKAGDMVPCEDVREDDFT